MVDLNVSLELLATHRHPHHLIASKTVVHGTPTKLILLESVLLLLHLAHHHLLHHKLLLLLVHAATIRVSVELVPSNVHASHEVHRVRLWLLSSHKALQIRNKTSFRLTCLRGGILWR